MRKRWWLWAGGLALVAVAAAYLVWMVSPWCGGGDGESRSANSIAGETDIVIEIETAVVVTEREQCAYFVTISGPLTGVGVSDEVSLPSAVELSFFVPRDADMSGLRVGALVVVGFDERIDDEAVTSAGVVVGEDHIDWIAPMSGWRELPPQLSDWMALVAGNET